MTRHRSEKWREFEQAVARFVSAIDPAARVRHDVRLPDRHTRRPRQRDVWIDARVGMFPVSILISCKRLRRRINQLDIDHFSGELQSSHAHKGVLFSYSPFGLDALSKAKALGIECCRLFTNESCDLPAALKLRVYCCTSHIGINPIVVPAEWDAHTKGDLLDIPVVQDNGVRTTVGALIAQRFRTRMAQAEAELANDRVLPSNWSQTLGVQPLDDSAPEIRIIISGIWRLFQADVGLHLLDGAYSHTTDHFSGFQGIYPPVVRGGTPGDGWTEIPHGHEPPPTATLTLLYNPDTVEQILEQMRPRSVVVGA